MAKQLRKECLELKSVVKVLEEQICTLKSDMVKEAKKYEEEIISMDSVNYKIIKEMESHIKGITARIKIKEEECTKLKSEVEALKAKEEDFIRNKADIESLKAEFVQASSKLKTYEKFGKSTEALDGILSNQKSTDDYAGLEDQKEDASVSKK
ncbi:hypothetical protein KI387_015128, partial [Taxus chinensis]